jgi:anti-anti-sigma factor
LAGEVDLDTAPMLGAYLRTHTAAKPTYLLFDLCEVNLLAAAGLTVIVTAQREDQSIHGDLRVIGVPSNRAVARVLRITGIDASLRIHATVTDPLDATDKITQS